MDVIFEQRDIAPSVRATRDGSAITLSIEYQTNGWYDEYLGYFLFDYGFGSVTFGGQFSYASVGGDDDGWIYAAVTATPGQVLAACRASVDSAWFTVSMLPCSASTVSPSGATSKAPNGWRPMLAARRATSLARRRCFATCSGLMCSGYRDAPNPWCVSRSS